MIFFWDTSTITEKKNNKKPIKQQLDTGTIENIINKFNFAFKKTFSHYNS